MLAKRILLFLILKKNVHLIISHPNMKKTHTWQLQV
jgi:hypothetical protein